MIRPFSLKGILIAVFTLVFPFVSNAQEWSTGILALNSGEHIIGDINYNYELNSVQIKYEDLTKTFSASQFYSFRIVENELFPARNFYVLPYAIKPNERPLPHIFESIYEGELSLLRRSFETEYPRKAYDKLRGRYVPESVVYEEYLAWTNGKIVKLKGGNQARIKAIGDQRKELKEFAKKYRLDLTNPADLANLVKYYNDLMASDAN